MRCLKCYRDAGSIWIGFRLLPTEAWQGLEVVGMAKTLHTSCLHALVKMADANLEGLGYNHKYDEQVTKVLAKVQDRMRVIEEGEPIAMPS